jgi:hypothetical protein
MESTHLTGSHTAASHLKLAHIVITLLIAVVGTLVTIGATYGTLYSRLGTAEHNIEQNRLDRVREREELKREIVPRGEQEAHWQSEEDQLKSIQADVREVRKALLDGRAKTR